MPARNSSDVSENHVIAPDLEESELFGTQIEVSTMFCQNASPWKEIFLLSPILQLFYRLRLPSQVCTHCRKETFAMTLQADTRAGRRSKYFATAKAGSPTSTQHVRAVRDPRIGHKNRQIREHPSIVKINK